MRAEESRVQRVEAGGTPGWVGLAVIVLAAVSALGVGVGWNATNQAKSAEQALVSQRGQNKLVGQDLQALNQRLTQSEEVNSQLQNALVAVTDKLKITQGELTTARRQNGEILYDYSKKMTALQSMLAGEAKLGYVMSLNCSLYGLQTGVSS